MADDRSLCDNRSHEAPVDAGAPPMEQLSGTDALVVAMENSRVHAHTGGLTILGRLDRCSSDERGKVRPPAC